MYIIVDKDIILERIREFMVLTKIRQEAERRSQAETLKLAKQLKDRSEKQVQALSERTKRRLKAYRTSQSRQRDITLQSVLQRKTQGKEMKGRTHDVATLEYKKKVLERIKDVRAKRNNNGSGMNHNSIKCNRSSSANRGEGT